MLEALVLGTNRNATAQCRGAIAVLAELLCDQGMLRSFHNACSKQVLNQSLD